MTDSNPWLFFTRPISDGLLAASALSVALAIWRGCEGYVKVSCLLPCRIMAPNRGGASL